MRSRLLPILLLALLARPAAAGEKCGVAAIKKPTDAQATAAARAWLEALRDGDAVLLRKRSAFPFVQVDLGPSRGKAARSCKDKGAAATARDFTPVGACLVANDAVRAAIPKDASGLKLELVADPGAVPTRADPAQDAFARSRLKLLTLASMDVFVLVKLPAKGLTYEVLLGVQLDDCEQPTVGAALVNPVKSKP
jgi:hypothetical protein